MKNILISGENFNSLFVKNFKRKKQIIFTKGRIIPKNTKVIDFSKQQNGSILGWQEGDTVYISSNEIIYADEDCTYMFSGRASLKKIEFNNFNTSDTKYMISMFSCCKNLIELDLSNFDISNVIDMGWIFCGCYSLKNLKLFKFNNLKIKNFRNGLNLVLI